MAQRSTYANGVERVFLWNLFNGVRIVSVSVADAFAFAFAFAYCMSLDLIGCGYLSIDYLWRGMTDILVFDVQAVNRAWRATGGRVWDGFFRWQVGGEY